ncbi:MAG: alpha,alpha-trehalose-phosphate synthase (UDP-forming) [Gemmatimonadaceae bacterium]
MRLSLRFIIPLALTLAALAYAVTPLVDRLTLRWFTRDLDLRASLIVNTIDGPVAEFVATNDPRTVTRFFERIARDERLYALALCPGSGGGIIASPTFPADIRCDDLDKYSTGAGNLLSADAGPLLVSVRELSTTTQDARLILVHDMSFVTRRSQETRTYLFYFFAGLAALVSLITVVIAQWSFRGWVSGLRAILRGEGLRAGGDAESEELQPIANDLRALIRDLEAENRFRDEEQLAWSGTTLREILDRELRGQQVIIVSNREPYIHVRQGEQIRVQRPASGLVTAVEPIMRACSGTWIAHGSGSADKLVVDDHDRIAVPVDDPSYSLRRVWLTREEEAGYYYGFANEGLWPLCHIAHVRPTFRASDWNEYEKVNRKFANAVRAESRAPDPIVLVQDYHFALLPRMIREMMPAATIITFWHIPWPNPEAFGICPWRDQLLDGLLGSSILGFHTQFHCNNFVDTVDRFVEARVDRETFSVSHREQTTAVKRYPISIDWPPEPELVAVPVEQCRDDVRKRHNLPSDHAVGIGVDRLDYTKGIEERLRAVERLLEVHDAWVGRFTFIQIAAPTRASIEDYQAYEQRVRSLVTRINARFSDGVHPAIILLVQHHEPHEVYSYYRAADVCFVSSLHDGMNLVAKEFVAARDDEAGVLVLSQFTGAARELPEALVVNPYDVEECAAALQVALTMPRQLQRARMRLMRGLVREFNVYRWAGRMLIDAAEIRRRGKILDRSSLAAPWPGTADPSPSRQKIASLG